MKNVAVCQVFHQRPNRNASEVEAYSHERTCGAEPDRQQNQGIGRVEYGYRIEPAPRNRGLLALVNAERVDGCSGVLDVAGCHETKGLVYSDFTARARPL